MKNIKFGHAIFVHQITWWSQLDVLLVESGDILVGPLLQQQHPIVALKVKFPYVESSSFYPFSVLKFFLFPMDQLGIFCLVNRAFSLQQFLLGFLLASAKCISEEKDYSLEKKNQLHHNMFSLAQKADGRNGILFLDALVMNYALYEKYVKLM